MNTLYNVNKISEWKQQQVAKRQENAAISITLSLLIAGVLMFAVSYFKMRYFNI